MELLGIIYICYLVGILFCMIIAIAVHDTNWKYAEIQYLFMYPLILFFLFRDLVVYLNNYLNKKQLKKMNLRILGKAMGFMFLPTLGVLLMLLVGFFDPIALWDFIKSSDGWAIFIRIVLFIAELVLVVVMYFYYLEEDTKKEVKASIGTDGTKRKISYSCYARDMFEGSDSNDSFTISYTKDPNIIVIEHSPRKK